MKLKIAVQAATPRASVEAASRFLRITNMYVPGTDTVVGILPEPPEGGCGLKPGPTRHGLRGG
jgi:hypothetical protein